MASNTNWIEIYRALDVLRGLWDGSQEAWDKFYQVVDYATVKTAYDALASIPDIDEETGIPFCRCGGKPEIEKLGVGGFWQRIKCPKCRLQTDYEPADSSKTTWLRAMGYLGKK